MAAVHEGEKESRVLRLVYSGSGRWTITMRQRYLQIYIAAAVHEPQYMRDSLVYCGWHVYCGTSAVDIDSPQFESFYTVPIDNDI